MAASPPCRLLRAGKDDAHEAFGVNVCGGLEQHIDRWSREVHELVNGKRELRAFIDQQVMVRRGEVYSSRLHAHLIFRLFNLQGALGRKNVHKQTRSVARQVQHDEQRCS